MGWTGPECPPTARVVDTMYTGTDNSPKVPRSKS